MRPQKVEDIEMLQGLLTVLRAKGYDGASLQELAEAAGLKKASLYHRFPGGKKEMASAVLKYVEEWIDTHICQVLVDDTLTPAQRLTRAIENIKILYEDGEAICIFRSMSLDTGLELFGNQLKKGMQKWIDAFASLGIAFHLEKPVAQEKALQTLIAIQGSLVVSKAMGSTAIFEAGLDKIWTAYTKIS